jgi:hypothetical protein
MEREGIVVDESKLTHPYNFSRGEPYTSGKIYEKREPG